MYRLLTVLVLVCLGVACNKEYSRKTDDRKISSIRLVCGQETIAKQYAANQPNEFSEYFFGGVAGNYFGYVSGFKISDNESLELRFGTLLTRNSRPNADESMVLVAPGKKAFGSLGAFTSFPQTKPGCAEIAFTDRNALRWSSTQITEKATRWGIETQVSLKQPQSEFMIDSVSHEMIADTVSALRVSGHFTCRLYQVNGDSVQDMSGSFSSVVGGGY